MQFNSFGFILLFMPVTLLAYFLLNKAGKLAGKLVLIAASAVFYGYMDLKSLAVLVVSMAVNYLFAVLIRKRDTGRRLLAAVPIAVNICLLLLFKYLNFGISNLNTFFGTEIALRDLILPVGLSFITFQQIAYVVAVYKGELENVSLVDYAAFILYFPKILMGPLTDPVDFITQLNDPSLKRINWENVAFGLKIFCFGLFKKVIIADTFAAAVTWGFNNVSGATAMDWIVVTLSYTFEKYFDFSGYCDMAVGVSLMLNILLPINFDSPYKAISIRDYWKRWHISLTRFFTKYIYFPLGGSRKGTFRTCLNVMIVFLISGIWHGANWTFILWGLLHGLFLVIDRLFDKTEERIFTPVRWGVTFSVLNILALLFRSGSISQWKSILKTMFGFQSMNMSEDLITAFKIKETALFENVLHLQYFTKNVRGFWPLVFLAAAFAICLIPENNYRNLRKISAVSIIAAAVAFIWSFICLGGESVFVYFNF